MAVRKITRNGKKSKDYYVFFSDHHGKEHSIVSGTDIGTARTLESKVLELVGCRVSKYYGPETQRWIDDLPNKLKKKFHKWDLLSGCRLAV